MHKGNYTSFANTFYRKQQALGRSYRDHYVSKIYEREMNSTYDGID